MCVSVSVSVCVCVCVCIDLWCVYVCARVSAVLLGTPPMGAIRTLLDPSRSLGHIFPHGGCVLVACPRMQRVQSLRYRNIIYLDLEYAVSSLRALCSCIGADTRTCVGFTSTYGRTPNCSEL